MNWTARAQGLEGLEPGIAARLEGLPVLRLPRGKVLFCPGEAARGFTMLISGRVEVYLVGPTGREILLYAIEPGQSCVQSTLGLLGGEDYTGEAVTVTDCEAVLAAIGAPARAQILRGASDWWHPGRHGMICLGPKKVLAVFGELHPRVLREMDVKGPAMAFTVWLQEAPFPRKKGATRDALGVSDFQAVERDFAFVLDADVEALNVVNAAAGADKSLIEEVRVFDEFVGGSLGAGKKSLAITVRLQPMDRTLTDDEIEAVGRKIVEKVEKATGGTLRG